MINSILLGKLVYKELKNNSALAKYIGSKVFPLVAELGTEYPYVAYSRESITPVYTKDFYTEDAVSVQVVVAATDYMQSLEIANIVRSIFECRTFKTSDIKVDQCTIQSVTEAYDDTANCFVQRLVFNFRIQ